MRASNNNFAFSLIEFAIIFFIYLSFLSLDTTWASHTALLIKSAKIFQIFSTALIIFGMYRLVIKILFVPNRFAKEIISSYLFAFIVIFYALNFLVKEHFEIFLGSRAFFMMRQPGFFSTIEVSLFHVFLALLFITLIAALLFFIKKISRKFLRRRLSLLVVSILVFVVIVEKIFSSYMFHVAYYETKEGIRNIPYYTSIKMSKFWSSFGIKRSRMIDSNYHKRSLEFKGFTERFDKNELPQKVKSKNHYNIILIALESFRGDVLTEEVMPNVSRLIKDDGAVYNHHHYSIGNSTAESLFGALSGQTSFYWLQSKKERRYPLLYKILDDLGYNQNLYYTSKLSFRGINNYVFDQRYLNVKNFVRAKNADYKTRKEFKSSRLEIDDLDALSEYLKTPLPKSNNLDIIYLYSAHYNYYYPKEFERFTPTLPNDFGINSMRLQAFRTELYNRYKNAAFFIDDMIGQIIQKLKKENVFENTIMVVIGDHGEELFEFGKIGHSINLKEYQTRTPFVFKSPKKFDLRYKITSHADIVPTILNLLDVNFDTDKFFSGKNLLAYDENKDFALLLNCLRSGTPLQFASIHKNYKLHFDNQASDILVRYATDLNDKVIRDFPKEKEEKLKKQVMANKSYFLQNHDN